MRAFSGWSSYYELGAEWFCVVLRLLASREFSVWSRGVPIAGEDGRGDLSSETSLWPWEFIVELGKMDDLGSEACGVARLLAEVLLAEVCLTEVWRNLVD